MIATLAGIVCLLGMPACSPSAGPPPAPTPEATQAATELAGAMDATLVFQRNAGIYTFKLGDDTPRQLVVGGTYPRWSPNGRQIAFVHGNRIMTIRADGKGLLELARGTQLKAIAWHPNGREVLYTDGNFIRAVGTRTKNVRNLAGGLQFAGLDTASEGKRVVATVRRRGYHIYAFDVDSGQHRKLRSGCSGSLSPDGERVTNNENNHRVLSLIGWEDGAVLQKINAEQETKFDNHFWSNHPDWIACIREGRHTDILLLRVSDGKSVQVTFLGDCDRPDLFVRTGMAE